MSLTESSGKRRSAHSDQESSEEDDKVETTPKRTFRQRFLRKDASRFNRYIKSTSTHGVVYIFVGKSKIRRLFWSVIVLTAAVGCLYNVVNRIVFLANQPTSTTVGVVQPEAIDFPAVTLCNLNFIKKSYLDNISENLGKFIRDVFYVQGTELECRKAMERFDHLSIPWNRSFSDLLWHGRHTVEETVLGCRFMGRECSSNDFVPTFTPSGVCYTFNSGRETRVLKTKGTGARFALTLIVNVLQSEYNAALNHDAGIRIAVHPQTEPAQPDELGIAVPPGRNAFIGVRQTNIRNRSSKRRCVDSNGTYTTSLRNGSFPYSVPACQLDCLRTNIAEKCNCVGTSSGLLNNRTHFQYGHLPNCTIKETCCQVSEIFEATSCNCLEACSKTVYTTSTSYSEFPARYAARDLAEEANLNTAAHFNLTFNASLFRENILGVNVYFETLTLEERVTDNAYDIVALLSDIGGQLGLFLGASVISVMELLTWLFDETKDRCCGVSERKLVSKLKVLVDKVAAKKCEAKTRRKGSGLRKRAESQGEDYRQFEPLQC